jgi:ribonucrease Y
MIWHGSRFDSMGLTLAAIDGLAIGLAAAALVVGAVLMFVLLKIGGGQTLTKAKTQAEQTIKLAEAEAKSLAAKAEAEAQRKMQAERQKFDAEVGGQREELREQERRLTKKEDQIDRKTEQIETKEKQLDQATEQTKQREAKLAKKEDELDGVISKQKEELLRVSGLSMDQARDQLLRIIEEDVKHDAARIVRKVTEDAQTEAKEKAREITVMAIQRYASEHAAESTVRSIPIPSDDMKGRIIGREGRNIRAIEKATGVDIIVDDTPGVIVVSCFDKVRQSIAAESLLKLIQDGRIHPSRIEEVVEQVRKEHDERITKYGKDAALEVNLRGLNPKIMDAMGRLHYRTSFGQNILRHSIEVGYLCQIIADQLGLNGQLARRCGFLHDIGKAMDHEMEGGHPKIGMEFARQYGEKEPVLNAIGGHHADIPATSFYTPIVMAADAVSGARPGARRESLEKYIQRLEQLQDIALSHEGVDEAYAIQAGREVRVMVDAKKVNDDDSYLIAKKIADRVSAEMTFPGEIKVTVLRETRAVEVAR